MPTNWRVYGKDTVAALLDRSDLPGFFSKKIIVGPNEAAVILKSGEPQGIITESASKVGGIFDRFASFFTGGDDVSIYFLDSSIFQVSIFLGGSVTTSESKSQSGQSSRTGGNAVQSNQDAIRPAGASKWSLSGLFDSFLGRAKTVGWQSTQTIAENTQSASITNEEYSSVCLLALSADREIIQASCNFKIRVNCTDNVHSVKSFLGLIKGKNALASWDIAALIRDELLSKVLIPEISTLQASQIRGDKALLLKIETDTRETIKQTLVRFGLVVESFTINWGLTEDERQEIDRKRQEREEKAIDFTHKRNICQIQREQEIGKTKLENLQQLKMAEAKGDQDLKKLLVASQLERDLMGQNQKIDVAKIDAIISEIKLEVDHKESTVRLAQKRAQEDLRLEIEEKEFKQKNAERFAAIDASDKEMWSMVKMKIELSTQKHERETAQRRQEADVEFRKIEAENEARYQERKAKLEESRERMGMMERLLSQGLNTGATESGVLKTMLEQATEQHYANTTDSMVESRANAKAASNNLDTFRAAQADERKHQVDMTRLSSEMMAAAKQNQGPVVIPGQMPQQGFYSPPSQPIIVNPPTAQPAASTRPCSGCGHGVQAQWKICPSCGNQLQQTKPKCHSCSGDVEPTWKICPSCGTHLKKGCMNPACPDPSSKPAGAKFCPSCGAS
jgi:hypothetical protein